MSADSTDSFDPFEVSLLKGLQRRASAIALMTRTVPRDGIRADQMLSVVRRFCGEVTADPQLAVIVPALWSLESTLVGAGRHPRDAAPLVTHPVPEPAQPIAHVGWATGISQRLGFDPNVLRAELAGSTDERYRGFCWDGIGAELLVDSRPSVRIAGRALGMTGGEGEPPDSSGGFAALRAKVSAEEERLAAHGLGRMVLVTQATLGAALRQADRLPPEWRSPAIQGMAFAFAMLNYADMPVLLERSREIAAPIAPAFHDGLVYALVFAEWLGRGMLASWRPSGVFEAKLIARARREAALSGQRGRPLPFALAEPAAELGP